MGDITERRLAEEALRDSQDRLRRQRAELDLMYDAVPVGLSLVDRDLRFVRINQRLAAINGLPADSYPGRTVREQLPDLADTLEPVLRRVFETGEAIMGVEIPHRGREGRGVERTCVASYVPVRDADGAILGVGCVVEDVTEQRAREQTLRESEERLRLAFAGAQEGVWDWNLETGAVVYSAEWMRMLGYAPHEIEPHVSAWQRLLHPDDRERARDVVEGVLRGEREYEAEFRLQHKSGHYKDVLSRGLPVRRDPAGPVVRIVGTHFDLTDRKARETALRQSEERLQFAFAGAQEGVWDWDLETGAVVYSAEWKRMLGYADEEIEPNVSAWERLLHPDDIPLARELVDGVKCGKRDYAAEFRLRHRDGHYVHVLSRGLPVRQERDGAVVRIVGTHFDLTERKRAEELLRRAHDELDARVRERTADLARANASLRDEMRERARAERARTDLLRRLAVAQEDERRRIAREMHDQLGEQLTALGLVVRRLKEACRDEPDLRRQVVELEGIAQQLDCDVDQLVWELRPTALDDLGLGAALGNYVHDWSRRVGVFAEFHMAGWDEVRLGSELETTLYRIAQEALNNCAKHARATSVDVILERRADHVSLIIEDDGVGFDAGDPGQQGQGLGLKGMRERALMVGASVEIESSAGEGTTVLVRLPTLDKGPA